MTNKPQTTLTASHYGRQITITEDTNDLTIYELFNMFKTICLGMTFTNEQFEDAVINIASNIKENE
jgi:hypothetical protein